MASAEAGPKQHALEWAKKAGERERAGDLRGAREAYRVARKLLPENERLRKRMEEVSATILQEEEEHQLEKAASRAPFQRPPLAELDGDENQAPAHESRSHRIESSGGSLRKGSAESFDKWNAAGGEEDSLESRIACRESGIDQALNRELRKVLVAQVGFCFCLGLGLGCGFGFGSGCGPDWALVSSLFASITACSLQILDVINSGSEEELLQLHGVGPIRAEAILEARKTTYFETVDDLAEVGVPKWLAQRIERDNVKRLIDEV
eukprot:scaffold699_cov231-Pinguiococcus_pyrenoidosus.AAC.13